MSMTAYEKRREALGMISELYLPTPELCEASGQDRPLYLVNAYAGRYATGAEVAGNIEKLAQLGRTARWHAAIDRWANMVREHSGNVDSLRWAFLQGMIYAGHAID
jgi:hypothetical protein